MEIIHSNYAVPKEIKQPAIFLAGPTARLEKPVPSWRLDAVKELEQRQFDGTVFIPEYDTFHPMRSYTAQVEWEWEALHSSNVIVFWVPRDLETLPAFTTNVEFGFYLGKKEIVYGRPNNSPKNQYLDWLFTKVVGGKPHETLENTISAALCHVGRG